MNLMTDPKIVLAQIDEIERSLESMFELKKKNSYTYKFIMLQIEKKMEENLMKVKSLVEKNNLHNMSFLDFKMKAIKSIHEAGMKRGEYDWANAFEKKFGV